MWQCHTPTRRAFSSLAGLVCALRIAAAGQQSAFERHSAREWEVLDLLHRGHTTKAIAQRLGLRDVTVRRHLSGALRKLRVSNRIAALKLLDDLQAETDAASG